MNMRLREADARTDQFADKADLLTTLSDLLGRRQIAPISLPPDELEHRRGEILLMNEVGNELDTVSLFVEQVRSEYESVAGLNISNAVANDGAIASVASNQRAAAYLLLELLQRGYGKVVTVRFENGVKKKYRIAQANRSVIKAQNGVEIMVVNRLAPVASRLVSAEVGDWIELPNQGDCEVVAVSNLDRSQQCDYDDFTQIELSLDEVDERLLLKQLRRSFNAWLERVSELSDVPEQDRGSVLSESEQRHDEITELVSEDISLGSSFYTRTTRSQEELIKRLRGGLLMVEGIAGSGKTSVALGRLKALHDSQFGFEEDGEKDKDDFFAHKHTMVGFVRHAQLIEYLKSTIDELNLAGIPVREFKELQNQLALSRAPVLQLKLGGSKAGKYVRAPETLQSEAIEGQICWLKAVEREMLNVFVRQIRERLATLKSWCREFEEKETYFQAREVGQVDFQLLMSKAWGQAEHEVDRFLKLLEGEQRPFALDRLMVKLKDCYDKIYDIVEDKSTWYLDGNRNWTTTRPEHYRGEGYKPFQGSSYGGKFSSQLKKMRDRFREQARRVLHADSSDEGQWLPKLADWYRLVLDTESVKSAAPETTLSSIRSRLDANQLTSVDINLLLAIGQIMSRGHEYRDDDQKRLVASLASPKFYTSVFVDEVQDFYEIEVFLMASMANPKRGAVTVVGDFKQQLYGGTVKDLRACFPYAQPSELSPVSLRENKRQITNLAKYSANFRRRIGDLTILEEVIPSNIPELHEESVADSELGIRIGEIVSTIPSTKSIAVISPTAELSRFAEEQARPHVGALFRETKHSSDNRDLVKRLYVHFTEPKPTKGLEFDVVIVTHFNKFDLTNDLEAHGAYVAVTRPRERLVLISAM